MHSRSFTGSFTGAVPLSGPPPLGASGPPPLNAAGSLLPGRVHTGLPNNRFNNGFNEANRIPTNRRPNRYRYGAYGIPYVTPYYGFDNGYYNSGDYDNGPGPYDNPDPATQQMLMNQDALGEQVQQLTAEIQDMKSRQQQQPPPYLQPNPPAQGTRAADADVQNDIPITLVLRSGQRLSVRNYAVTNGVFWDFSKQPAQKIPVSSIDVAASTKATEASGADFPPLTQ